jgi:hypothetical protein
MSVGVGVIGTGVMGSEHARLLGRETSDAHLAGVFDADAARAQAAAADATVFPDPRSLIWKRASPSYAKSRWLPPRQKLCGWFGPKLH